MKNKILAISSFLMVFLIFLACNGSHDESSKGIEITKRVIDSTNVLSSIQRDSILMLISDLEKSTGSQLAVIIVNTLHGQNINEYSLHMAESLSLGRDKFSDGVLITLVLKDRKTRIEVGTGLEQIVKDEIAARIIREKMIPKFKVGKIYLGVLEGVRSVKTLIEEHRNLIHQTSRL